MKLYQASAKDRVTNTFSNIIIHGTHGRTEDENSKVWLELGLLQHFGKGTKYFQSCNQTKKKDLEPLGLANCEKAHT